MEKQNYTPRVYVGTYKKYNEGSSKGGWVTLTDYPSYDDFIRNRPRKPLSLQLRG